MSRQSIISYSLAVLILAGAGYFYYSQTGGPDVDIRKFSGFPVAVSDNTVTLRGYYEGSSGTISDELSSEREFSFRVDGETDFEKLETYLPDYEEPPENGAVTSSFNVWDLPNSRTTVSLGDFLNDLSDLTRKRVVITADFENSIINSNNSIASFVFYDVWVLPEPPQFQNE